MVFPAHTQLVLMDPPSPLPLPIPKELESNYWRKKGVRTENENDYMGKLREGEETLKKKRGEMEGSSLAEYFFPFFFLLLWGKGMLGMVWH